MTKPDTAEVERIAAGLTKAQRAAFARSQPEEMHRDWQGRISTWGDEETGLQLIKQGLATPGRGRIAYTFPFLTPLGKQVKEWLSRECADVER
jgi:hypothetical protein